MEGHCRQKDVSSPPYYSDYYYTKSQRLQFSRCFYKLFHTFSVIQKSVFSVIVKQHPSMHFSNAKQSKYEVVSF